MRLAATVMLGLVVACTPSKEKSTERSVPAGPKLPAVTIDGTYFVRDGKRFVPVGTHWVPAKGGLRWPLEWDP